MNNFYSKLETFYPRWITPILQQATHDHAVVILTGARQVGKSTLLLNARPFCQWRFHSLDNFATLRQVQQEPEALWAGARHIVIDEVQKAPRLLSAIKQAVDRNPGRFNFVLSGSANLLLMKQISESLAGRAVYFILDPMTMGEIQKKQPSTMLTEALAGKLPAEECLRDPPPDPTPIILRGLMPGLLTLSTPQACLRWWDGYVATYLERDLRQLSQIENLLDFRRLMELTALRCGQLLNQSEIARDAGISQSTVHRYLNVLEATHMFERIPAYTFSHTTRLLKSPKAYWNDTGLAVFLSGYFTEDDLRSAREFGAFFETFIFHHLRVLSRLMVPPARLYFWRTRSGVEVDFVLEHGRRLLAIEVKLTTRPSFSTAAGLIRFLQDHPHAVGLLVHCGSEILRLHRNIAAVPWTMLSG
ncbi:MAG: ATP-binding protein [Deltaproteobacteria bacterium]|nr:ATP-binding protein [Deltaproteobacteria bacterium]MBW2153806.1 ATP-binding protein [Deltaproteobacteria bacterium]